MTASWVASSSLVNSLHVMVSRVRRRGNHREHRCSSGSRGSECSVCGMPGSPAPSESVSSSTGDVDRRSRLGGHRDGAGRGALAAGGQARRGSAPPPATRTCVLICGNDMRVPRRSVGLMPADLPPALIHRRPTNSKAPKQTFAVLQQRAARHRQRRLVKQTPCREFDVAQLTDHLMNSITVIGGAAGAELPERDRDRLGGAAGRSSPRGPRWTRGTGAASTAWCLRLRTKRPPG